MYSSGVAADVQASIPVHSPRPAHSSTLSTPDSFVQSEDAAQLPRSASYTHIPGINFSTPVPGIKRTFSENVLALPTELSPRSNPSTHTANKELFRRASRSAKRRLTISGITLSVEDLAVNSAASKSKERRIETNDGAKSSGRSVAETFRSLAKKSWI